MNMYKKDGVICHHHQLKLEWQEESYPSVQASQDRPCHYYPPSLALILSLSVTKFIPQLAMVHKTFHTWNEILSAPLSFYRPKGKDYSME